LKSQLGISLVLVSLLQFSASAQSAEPASTWSTKLTSFALELNVETLQQPVGSRIDARAARLHWEAKPKPTAELLRNSTMYVGDVDGHRVMIGHDDTRAALFVVSYDPLDPADVKAQLSRTYLLKPAERRQIGDLISETFFAESKGKEVTFIQLMYDVPGKTSHVDQIGFCPSALARKEIAEHAGNVPRQ
jgi:hypothetical protein